MIDGLGRSGDTIIIDNDIVIKVCNTNQDRFRRSFEKQQTFASPHIKNVPVLCSEYIDNQWRITMPYLYCDNSMVWISKSGKDQIDELTNMILDYFSNIISNSIQKPFNYEIWHNKLNELISKVDDDMLSVIDWLKNLKFEHQLYYGMIHGDLTLTNLLISEDNGLEINAIDFLNVFIESVVLDICKWRQDTAHFWTLNIVENKSYIDISRVKLLLTHIDKQIETFINENEVLREYYLPFQVLNLLRILPYNKDDQKVQSYLKSEIIRLYNDRNNTNNAGSGQINKV